ncbi:hypothetical protein GCM10010300_85980 [Streptomyces olivaceoviridis]|nr:hypothetical protein GCM10010300_85980 [Streptomyces olivaceoviridis]
MEEQVWSCDFCDMAVIELYSVIRFPMEGNEHIAVRREQTFISRVGPVREPCPLSQDAPGEVCDLFLEAG